MHSWILRPVVGKTDSADTGIEMLDFAVGVNVVVALMDFGLVCVNVELLVPVLVLFVVGVSFPVIVADLGVNIFLNVDAKIVV